MTQAHKVLMVIDAPSKLLEMDNTLRMIQEMLERENIFEVDFVNYDKLDLNQDADVFLSAIPAQKVLHCDISEPNFLGLDRTRPVHAKDYDLILLRQDPPVNDRFIKCCQLFEKCPAGPLFVNSAEWIYKLKEHIIPTDYPDYSIPTTVCNSVDELEKAVRSQTPEAVIKPENECSGNGVVFVKPDVNRAELEEYYKTYGPVVIVQPYLDEITKSGDLRILTMNEKVLGAVLRVPQKGSRLANFHQGGYGAPYEPTQRQIEISKVIAKDLAQKGIYFIGFDFIGDQLSEVNITSPSGITQMNEIYENTRVEKDFNDELLVLLEKHKKTRP